MDANGNQYATMKKSDASTLVAEYYAVGGMVYGKAATGDGTWFAQPLGEGGFAASFSDGNLFNNLKDAKKVGSEAVGDLQADKYDYLLDLASKGFDPQLEQRGYAWIEPGEHALVKAVFEYPCNMLSEKGVWHAEFVAGKADVAPIELPAEATNSQAAATGAGPQETEVEVRALGEAYEMGGLRVKLEGADMTSGGDECPAGEGKYWVLGYVDIESIGSEPVEIGPGQFQYVDREGGVYALQPAAGLPASWEGTAQRMVASQSLEPGATLVYSILLLRVDIRLMPGLKVQFMPDALHIVEWSLGADFGT